VPLGTRTGRPEHGPSKAHRWRDDPFLFIEPHPHLPKRITTPNAWRSMNILIGDGRESDMWGLLSRVKVFGHIQNGMKNLGPLLFLFSLIVPWRVPNRSTTCGCHCAIRVNHWFHDRSCYQPHGGDSCISSGRVCNTDHRLAFRYPPICNKPCTVIHGDDVIADSRGRNNNTINGYAQCFGPTSSAQMASWT
jgi:hypothetical protein